MNKEKTKNKIKNILNNYYINEEIKTVLINCGNIKIIAQVDHFNGIPSTELLRNAFTLWKIKDFEELKEYAKSVSVETYEIDFVAEFINDYKSIMMRSYWDNKETFFTVGAYGDITRQTRRELKTAIIEDYATYLIEKRKK